MEESRAIKIEMTGAKVNQIFVGFQSYAGVCRIHPRDKWKSLEGKVIWQICTISEIL